MQIRFKIKSDIDRCLISWYNITISYQQRRIILNYEKIADYVSRAINNDQDAYTQLYNCTYHIVYNIACASIKDPEEAKDVVSEVYLRAFSHLDSLKNELTFVSWLITITNNICRDHLSEHGHAPMVVSPSEPNMAQADPIEEWLDHDNLKTALND